MLATFREVRFLEFGPASTAMRLRVVDGELLENRAGHAQRGGFLGAARSTSQ